MKLWIYLLSLFLINESALANTENVEKIKVTGSRIKRIDIEGPNPVVIYTKEDLENSGYSSAGDFLRDTTISHFGVSREEAGSSASGFSSASIRGEPTLILINGLRVVEDPDAQAVDLNMVPIYAIERVEVLKDGGSALYGSDAVGGVINFITKKDFSGAEIHAQIAPTIDPWSGSLKGLGWTGGSRGDLAAVFGSSNKKSSYIGSFQLRFQDSIENYERKWTNKTISPYGPYAIFNGEVDPNCPAHLKTSDGCEINLAKYSTRLPRYFQAYTYLKGDYKWGENKFYTQFLASYKNNKWAYAPIPGGLSLPADHKMSFGQGEEGTLIYRFMEAGQRDTSYNNYTMDWTAGMTGYLSPTWDYDFNIKFAYIRKNEKSEGLLKKKELTEAIVSGMYDPYNPLKRDLGEALYTAQSYSQSMLFVGAFDLSGESGFWDIDLATGLQAYGKNYQNRSDEEKKAGNILSNAGSDGQGSRYVASYYLEAVKSFADMLEIQLAGRADYYRYFGLTANPKLAFRLKPSDQFLLRGSIGTAFTAPSLEQIYSSSGQGFPYLYDTVACYNELKATNQFENVTNTLENQTDKEKDNFIKEFLIEPRQVFNQKNLSAQTKKKLKELSGHLEKTDYCKERQSHAFYKGNRNLQPTKSLVASLGSVMQFSEDHSLIVDLWYIRKNDIPSYGLSKKTFDAELKFGNDYLSENNVSVQRDETHKYKAIKRGQEPTIKTNLLNLANTTKYGLDLMWSSDISNIQIFNNMSPYFKDEVSYIFSAKSEAFPKMLAESIGNFGAPRWRNRAVLGLKNKKHNISLTALTTAPFAKLSDPLTDLPTYTRLDLDYQWIMNEKTSFKFGWSNLLFSTPPYDKAVDNGGFDHDIFEARGPFVFAGIKHSI